MGEQKGDFTKTSYTNPTDDEILNDYTLAKEDIPKKAKSRETTLRSAGISIL